MWIGKNLFDSHMNLFPRGCKLALLRRCKRLPTDPDLEAPQAGGQPEALGEVACGEDPVEEVEEPILEGEGLGDSAGSGQVVDRPR